MSRYWGKTWPVAVGTALDRQGRVLLLQRVKEPYLGFWGLVGGKVEFSEHPADAMVREFREETGCPAAVTRFCGVVSERHVQPGGTAHYLLHVFVLRAEGQPSDHGEGEPRWVAPAELDQLPVIPSDRWIVQQLVLPGGPPRLVGLLAQEDRPGEIEIQIEAAL